MAQKYRQLNIWGTRNDPNGSKEVVSASFKNACMKLFLDFDRNSHDLARMFEETLATQACYGIDWVARSDAKNGFFHESGKRDPCSIPHL